LKFFFDTEESGIKFFENLTPSQFEKRVTLPAANKKWIPYIKKEYLISSKTFRLWVCDVQKFNELKLKNGTPAIDTQKYYVDSLNVSDTITVAHNWPYYRSKSDEDFVASVIAKNICKCIRIKGADSQNGETLAAWILTYNDGTIGMLHTFEQYRRQGLGKRVAFELLNEKIEKIKKISQIQPDEVEQYLDSIFFCYILENNLPSEAVFTYFGFESKCDTSWAHLVETNST